MSLARVLTEKMEKNNRHIRKNKWASKVTKKNLFKKGYEQSENDLFCQFLEIVFLFFKKRVKSLLLAQNVATRDRRLQIFRP